MRVFHLFTGYTPEQEESENSIISDSVCAAATIPEPSDSKPPSALLLCKMALLSQNRATKESSSLTTALKICSLGPNTILGGESGKSFLPHEVTDWKLKVKLPPAPSEERRTHQRWICSFPFTLSAFLKWGQHRTWTSPVWHLTWVLSI